MAQWLTVIEGQARTCGGPMICTACQAVQERPTVQGIKEQFHAAHGSATREAGWWQREGRAAWQASAEAPRCACGGALECLTCPEREVTHASTPA